MVIFAVVAALLLAERERATFQRGARERTLALMTAVDTELKRSIGALQALAASRTLDSGDLRGFYEEALRVIEGQPGWLTIILAAPEGQQIVNPRQPFGASLPPIIDRTSFEQVLQTKTPVVGYLTQGLNQNLHAFPVRVPVIRDGRLKYVLSAVVKPERIGELFSAQRLPPGWVAVVLDANQRIVTRTVDPERTVGQPGSASLRSALARAPEGWFQGKTVEGWDVYTPYNRSTFSGWTVAMGIPTTAVEAAARGTNWAMASGISGAALVAFALALALGRRIANPIASLALAAKAIGSGERPQVPETSRVEELSYLSHALENAAATVRAREETQGQLAAIVEASNDAIISFNLDGLIVTSNPAATRLFGYTAEELYGQRVALLVPSERAHESAELIADVGRGEAISGFETVRLKKHGTLFDVAVSMSPIRNRDGAVDGIAEIFRDITARKRAEQARRESEQRFSALAELVPEFVWSAQPEGAIDYFNQRWYEYGGLSSDQSLGHGWLEAVHPEERQKVRQRWQEALRTGKPIEVEYRIRAADGQYQWFLTRAVPLCNPDGTVIKWFGTCTNIERQKRAEEVLREADKRKDEFLAMLGHELRNPLGIISTVVQLLRRKAPPDPALVELREIIERQVEHMARLMDDLLDVSRIARGRVQLSKELCDFAAIARQTVEDYRNTFETSDLQLELDIPDRPLWVMGDRTRLAQAVGNVLHNASKFTEAGGRVVVRLETDGATASLTVRDTGIGMEPETLAGAFEPFHQADRSIARSRGGLGLGLAIVKGLVELHGGGVSAHSGGPGQGSEIMIRLPLEEVAAEPTKPTAAVGQSPRPQRILIIEDNPVAAVSMRMFLTDAGHIVQVASNGPTGIEAARRFRPEVVLCDIGLPGLDGYEVARALRQESNLSGIYLLAITGYGQYDDQKRAREAGFDIHLRKPVDLDRLQRILARTEARESI